MPAWRLMAWQEPPRLVEVAVPEPGPGQVRVRVAGCGLCHSDLSMSQMPAGMGSAIGWQVPFTLGHETAGWIDAVGSGILGVAEGDAVALVSPSSCGTCRWCRRGQENACPSGLRGRGYGLDGGLATHVVVDQPERSVVPLGGLDPFSAAPLTDAGATSYHAVNRVIPHLSDDSTVVVIGVGGLGAFVVQLLRSMSSARVVAIDHNGRRRELALALGAHDSLDGVDEQTKEVVANHMAGASVDAVIDLVGTDATIAAAVSMLAPGGVLALVGAAGGTLRKPWYGSLPRDGQVFAFQGSDLSDAHGVVALAAEGRIRVDIDEFSLDRVAAAYQALDQGALEGRAVVRP